MLEWDPERPARLAAIVCHPHPRYGGTMHNKVVFRAAKAAIDVAAPALRFNFRGVGLSQGKFEDGVGERDDARAALDYLASRFPTLPVCMMGFSFGSVVGLAVGAEDDRVKCLVGMGLPVKSSDFSFLRGIRKPKLIVQGIHDEFGPLSQLEEVYSLLAEPKRLHLVEDADHFFAGKLPELQSTIQKFLREILDGIK